MCGIAGIVGSGSPEERDRLLLRMLQAIAHRGPDDDGRWVGDGVAVGMRRLSIIDLGGGHQPMWRDDGIGVVFNGEIYNYRSLRTELETQGYVFRTRSDTEVLLHLYHRHGLEAIQRLEGMFAIALYDGRQRVVHLIRDRLGVKPLYYGLCGSRFLFASEIKGILATLDKRPDLNLAAVSDYLTLRYVPGPETIWRGIFKLPPATVMSVDVKSGERTENRYWQVHVQADPEDPHRSYVKEFENLFLASVEKRLLAADVPVGVLLSGGLDSSAVSMAADLLGHRDLHTFSVAFEDGGVFDETPYARMVAEQLGTRHHEVRIGRQEFLDFLPDLVHHTDEPLADLACVPLFHVCRLARQHVKAVLSGEGSDEILAGYNLEVAGARLRGLRALTNVLPPSMLRILGSMVPGRHGQTLRLLGQKGLSGLWRARAAHITGEWMQADKEELWPDAKPGRPTEDLIRSWYSESASSDPLDQYQDVLVRSWLVEDLLMKADKMSMACSLELREPFLDHALVQWAAPLPQAWKVGDRHSGQVSKRVLREYCRGRLPEVVLTRQKQGFPVPAYRWLTGPLGRWCADLLTGPGARVAELFARQTVREAVEEARSADTWAARRVWVLIVLEMWLRRWL
jgi:asparagine synthase (glutamine-hydrolysing)